MGTIEAGTEDPGRVVTWRPGPGSPLVRDVFGRDTPFDVGSLGLDADLAERLLRWNSVYREEVAFGGDADWVGQGQRFLIEVRQAIYHRFRIAPTDAVWDEPPA
ncbi:MAG: hypothetical protein JWM76_3913 [Pseudonocardiales bacterium]|nr:hypothetical protein [Pseudonocardiales bacterium]